MDGPGLYAWYGPFEVALSNAFDNLMDNQGGDLSELARLDIWQVDIPDGTCETAGWPDYGVFQVTCVKPENLKCLGNILSLRKSLGKLNKLTLQQDIKNNAA